MRSPLALVLVGVLRLYRAVISPLYGQVCRYHPSCSAYALTAVQTHGAVKGSWLATRRLARCHPWSAGGVDPVPAAGTYRWWGPAEPARAEETDEPARTTRPPAARGA